MVPPLMRLARQRRRLFLPFALLSTARETADLDCDAEVGLNWRHSPLSNSQVSVNIGLENGINEWGGTSGSLASWAGGSFSEAKHAPFAAAGDSSDSWVRQTVRVWTGWDTFVEFRPYLRA